MLYCCMILLTPAVIITLFCIYGINTVKLDAIKNDEILAEKIKLEMDNVIEKNRYYSIILQSNEDFITLLDQEESPAEKKYEASQVLKAYSSILAVDELVTDFMVYIPHKEVYYMDYMETLHTNNERNYYKYFSFDINMNGKYTDLLIKSKEKENSLYYIDTMKMLNYRGKKCQFVTTINMIKIQEVLNQYINMDNQGVFAIVNKKSGEVVYASNNKLFYNLKEKKPIANHTYYSINKHNDSYSYIFPSIATDYEYVIIADCSEIYSSVSRIKLIICLCFILLLISTIVVLQGIKMRERDFAVTVMSVMEQHKIDLSDNHSIFESITKLIELFLTDKKKLESSLNENEKYLKNYFVNRLLFQSIKNEQEYNKIIEKYGIVFDGNYFRIMLLEHSSIDEEEDAGLAYENFYKSIEPNLEEIFGINQKKYILNQSGRLIIIINYDTQLTDSIRLIDLVSDIKQKLEDESIIGTLSRKKESLIELKEAYREVEIAADQCILENIYFKEYRKENITNTKYNRYYQYEENFRKALRESNYETAQIIWKNVQDILKKSFSDNSADMICRLYGIIDSILGEMSFSSKNETKLFNIYQRLNGEQNMHTLKMIIEEMLTYLISSNSESQKEGLCSQVEEFIKQHYQDKNLSVGMISEKEGIEISQLSKKFKKEKGINIIDYIHMVRIKSSKELLCNETLTIKQIAELCGYVNSDAFIRAFKRYEGVTPGKYKNNLKISNN